MPHQVLRCPLLCYFHSLKMRWCTGMRGRSEERRVGKECRSRCDWSSDVCSSDLHVVWHVTSDAPPSLEVPTLVLLPLIENAVVHGNAREIGRASCRERV